VGNRSRTLILLIQIQYRYPVVHLESRFSEVILRVPIIERVPKQFRTTVFRAFRTRKSVRMIEPAQDDVFIEQTHMFQAYTSKELAQ
jgi:hypothetical protein